MARGGNHNISGKNQYGFVASANDPVLRDALQRYHREGYTNNKTISELLLADYGVKCSESTVKRRRSQLGLYSSGRATKEIPEAIKRQMVIDAVGDDPKQHRGPRTIKQDIAQRTGVHLTRDFIQEVMHEIAPEGFKLRKPSSHRHLNVQPSANSNAESSTSTPGAGPSTLTSTPLAPHLEVNEDEPMPPQPPIPSSFQPPLPIPSDSDISALPVQSFITSALPPAPNASVSTPAAQDPSSTPDQSSLPGPNALWWLDHHSKLSRIGMEIIGIRDKASGKWLGLWAVPNGGGRNGSAEAGTNEQWRLRMKRTVALLYLCVCEVYSGIPMQTTTQCVQGESQIEFAQAIRDLLLPVPLPGSSSESPTTLSSLISPAEADARIARFLQRVDSMVIGKGWFGFSIGWGDNIVTFFDEGAKQGVYDASRADHRMLAQFIWSQFLRTELPQIRDQMNSARIHKRASTKNMRLVGGTPNALFALPEKFGMRSDCLVRLPGMPMEYLVHQEEQQQQEMGGLSALAPVPETGTILALGAAPGVGSGDGDVDGGPEAIMNPLEPIIPPAHDPTSPIIPSLHPIPPPTPLAGVHHPSSHVHPLQILQRAKLALGGDDLLRFLPADYVARAEGAYRDELGAPSLTYRNVWDVFGLMSGVLSRSGGADGVGAGPIGSSSTA